MVGSLQSRISAATASDIAATRPTSVLPLQLSFLRGRLQDPRTGLVTDGRIIAMKGPISDGSGRLRIG